ncbi:MAG: thioredoxin [Omnitrophica bacterium RIFCSPLOWO2_12_FULL_44_17]|uniref:Thioredoxin n=1 Tax=Candidatus Danuiimicrobium aquiferis TaxID=1801832 RepID=A0A1G1KT64_9BACT|nr:MAG: thioredoxin [Omnitrophica bacterium RIFCSPHIGHO2_02_FULL_45_28]OGW89081.1 MAG: thioredoxin [Omnitrophica bacterium RIFCSPHIGHO2_12_FULL_44_12]OGW96096.1 MAG: thioredoxin [Omnitrophica bacterium RIFCSPLOWO2_12_FULL_44_17]OGX02393.1 MAG: thioredoxin [Omnitrophica bacterium RIFCSPLOWO2_02_FULL_44_11]
MSVVEITDANFQSEVLESQVPVLVDFWAEWCGPCKMLTPIVDKLAENYKGKMKVGKVNVDDNSEIPQQYGIQGIPTLILFKDGQKVNQVVGFQPEERLKSLIQSAFGL